MSQLSRFVALGAIASLCACSGSDSQNIDNLRTGRKDAGPDAAQAEAGSEDDDWPWEDGGEPSGEPDAASADAGSPDAASADAGPDASGLVGPGPDAASLEDAGDAGQVGSMDAGNADAGDAGDASADAGAADSAVPDAGDAAADAAVARLRLTLTRGGVPVPDSTVFFHGVENVVVGSAQTDSTGRVQTDLGVSNVTVLLPVTNPNFNAHLFTYFGVQAGDDLKLELPPEATRQVSYELSVPPSYAARYDVTGGPYGCVKGGGDGQDVLPATHQPGCLAPTGNTLLVSAWQLASDDAYYFPFAYARVVGLPARSLADGTSRLGVDDYWEGFGGGRDVHLALHGALTDQRVLTGLWAYWGTQGGQLGPKGGNDDLTGDGEIEYVAPSFGFDAFLSTGFYQQPQISHRLQVRSADGQSPGALELSHALPNIDDFTMDTELLNAPRVYWNSAEASERDAFLFEGVLRISGVEKEPIFGALWTGVVSGSRTSVRLPPMPTEILNSVSPNWSVSWEAARMSQVRSSEIEGYDGLRQQTLRYVPVGGDLIELRLTQPGEAEVATWDHRT
jgi:hypothetical protein